MIVTIVYSIVTPPLPKNPEMVTEYGAANKRNLKSGGGFGGWFEGADFLA